MVKIVILLLFFMVDAFAQPLQRSAPDPIRRRGTPEDIEYGYNLCDQACDENTGERYQYRGFPGSRAGWEPFEFGSGGGDPPGPVIGCGNSIIDGTDQCDGSTLPSGDATCLSCTTSCTCVRTNVCGNSMVEISGTPIEACDPPNVVGTASGCTGTDRCSADCLSCITQTAPVCGDNAVDAPEVCDPPFEDGTCGSGNICNKDCTACTDCGDGTLDGGEQCDPGDSLSETSDNDPQPSDSNCAEHCQPNCTCPTAACGNGIFEPLGGEACDPALVVESGDESCPKDDCTGTCRCNCGPQNSGGPVGGTCNNGDGILNRDCIGLASSQADAGDDEDCEFGASTPGTGTTFDKAMQLDGTGYFTVAGLEAAAGAGVFDLTTHEFAISFFIKVTCELESSTTGSCITANNASGIQYLIGKGANGTDDAGWSLFVQTNGVLRLESDETGASTDQNCDSTAIFDREAAGGSDENDVFHIIVTRDDTDCNFWALNLTDGETIHTQVDGGDAVLFETMAESGDVPFIGAKNNSGADTRASVILDELKFYKWADDSGGVDAFEATLEDTWDGESCSGDGLAARFAFDETDDASPTITECVADGTDGTGTAGGWDRITSPVDALLGVTGGGSATNCVDSSQACNETTCQCEDEIIIPPPTPTPTGPTVYISPTGSDSQDGTTEAKAVKTWGRAFDLVSSNNTTVIALDGTYTIAANGRAIYDCGVSSKCETPSASSNIRWCGASDATRVVIKAKNERQAWIKAGGTGAGFNIDRCRNVTIQGFRVTSQPLSIAEGGDDDDNIKIKTSDNIVVRRNLITTNNNEQNQHLYRCEDCLNPIVEENEFYDYHRHAINFRHCIGGRVTGNYANSRDRDCGTPCEDNNWSGGDEFVSVYGSNGLVIENNIGENQAGGFQMHSGPTVGSSSPYDGTEYGGSDAKFHGNVLLGDNVCFYTDYRNNGAIRNNLISNNACLDAIGFGYYIRTATNLQVFNGTTFDTGSAGLILRENETGQCTTLAGQNDASGDGLDCSAVIRNSLFRDNNTDMTQTNIGTDYDPCTVDRGVFDSTADLMCDGTTGGGSDGCDCTNEAVWSGTNLTAFGIGTGQSALWVPQTTNNLDSNGDTTTSNKVCHGGTDPWEPCASDAECAGGGTCANDIGANIICRTYNGTRTDHDQCTGAGTPFPCCTGAGAGDCDVWARDSDAACGGVACDDNALGDCTSANDFTVGGANFPACEYHFFGCGAIVTGCSGIEANGCNNTNGASCLDVHERLGFNLGDDGTAVVPPVCP